MEIHVQKCQNCGSNQLKNIIFREIGEQEKIYVQCHDCKEFVARYTIAPLGYYHHKAGFESFLRSFNRSGEFISGRRVQNIFERRKIDEIERFDEVINFLKKRDEKK